MSSATPSTPSALAGRQALVTGAASGIGAAVAARLAAAGAEVHLLDRDDEGVAKVAAQVHGTPHVVDLTDEAAIAGLDLDVDILVNNAGIQHVAPVEEFDPERFRTIHALMLHAPFLLARRVLPGMYARGWGRLVHVSSVHGHRASAYKSAYVSAKHGLEGLSKVIALEAPTASPRTRSSTPSCSPAPRSSGSSSPRRSPTRWPSCAARPRPR
jgi:3-hydroxybutyrate dehydrogenase